MMKKITAIILTMCLMISMTGCFSDKTKSKVNSAQISVSPKISQNEQTIENNTESSSDESENVKKYSFGIKSEFNGIEVEADENGEVIVNNIDGILLIKITDKRFNSLKKLKRYINNNFSGEAKKSMLNACQVYFAELKSGFYLVNGTGTRGISSLKKYTASIDSDNCDMMLTLSCAHTKECRKEFGFDKSHFNFVRSSGSWMLDEIILYY